MKKITTILFDVDGTLLDTTELIFQAFGAAFTKHNELLPPQEALRGVIGKPLVECYQILTRKTDVASYCLVHHDFQLANLGLSKPFLNTLLTLKELKNRSFKMGAVTSRKKKSADETMKQAGINEYMDFSVFADEVQNHKPHPEPFLKALEALESTSDETLMVGDTEADILGGKNLNMKTAGAVYGFHGEKLKDSQPDYLLYDVKDLLSIPELS